MYNQPLKVQKMSQFNFQNRISNQVTKSGVTSNSSSGPHSKQKSEMTLSKPQNNGENNTFHN